MRSVLIRCFYWSLMLLMLSCSLFQKGYTDSHGQYVPKRPNYKLKNKPGVFPVLLDTVAVYRLIEMYDGDRMIYPIVSPGDDNDNNSNVRRSNDELKNSCIYKKFYGNGRCLAFNTTQNRVTTDITCTLKKSDLNPDNKHYSKEYYYSPDGRTIQIEVFVYGEGTGLYFTLDYFFGATPDLLIHQSPDTREIYQKQTIPADWNDYKVNW